MTAFESRKYNLISAIIGDANEDRVLEIERLYSQEPRVYSMTNLKRQFCSVGKITKAVKSSVFPTNRLKGVS